MSFKKKTPQEYTTKEAAEFLGVSTGMVRQYIGSGKLKSEKRGRSHYILLEHLEEFVKSRTTRNY